MIAIAFVALDFTLDELLGLNRAAGKSLQHDAEQ